MAAITILSLLELSLAESSEDVHPMRTANRKRISENGRKRFFMDIVVWRNMGGAARRKQSCFYVDGY